MTVPLPPPSSAGPPVALKETCRYVAGAGVPLWPYHARRLVAGGCPDALVDGITAEVARVAGAWAGPPSSRLRLTVRVESDGVYDVRLERRLSSLDVVGGPVLALVAVADLPPLPPGPAKPAGRSWWDAAHGAARGMGAHQAAVVSDGLVLDGSTATVWAVREGTLVTPPAPHAVSGVARAFVLERAERLGLATDVRPLAADELDGAEEVFLTNAFAGAVPVRGRSGPVFAAVAGWFAELWAPAPARRSGEDASGTLEAPAV